MEAEKNMKISRPQKSSLVFSRDQSIHLTGGLTKRQNRHNLAPERKQRVQSGSSEMRQVTLLFDSHLDLAWNAVSFGRDLTLGLEEIRAGEAHMTDKRSRGRCTTSLPELRKAGVAVCVATLLARSGLRSRAPAEQRAD